MSKWFGVFDNKIGLLRKSKEMEKFPKKSPRIIAKASAQIPEKDGKTYVTER